MSLLEHDLAIISGLQKGGSKTEYWIKQIYLQYKGKVLGYLQNRGAHLEDAKDVFQDAVIAVFENISSGKFRGESSLSNYLIKIAWYLFINKIKRKDKEREIMDKLEVDETMVDHLPKYLEKERKEEALAIFDQLGATCKEVLHLSIYYDYSMKDLATHMAYANEQIARNKKYRCLERLRKIIDEKPHILKRMVE